MLALPLRLHKHRRRVERVVVGPGSVIADRYRLEAEIGHGGFSHVFRATELKLGREVALKLLSKDSVDAAGGQRFRREAELARQLQHPNTVRLLDFDIEAKPMPFIVYELLEGETLERAIKTHGAMSEERLVRVVSQVLKSLMEAHAAGIVHRDMKPGNVFLCTYAGEADFVKVLDFGIAKSAAPEMQLTAAGMLVGTPRYMPPDQIRGEPLTPAMDIYAIGMMMAEMLSGAPLIRGSPMDACRAQLSPVNIELPASVARSRLGRVIRRSIDKDPRSRHGTAADLLSDLELALKSPAPPPSPVVTKRTEPPVSSGEAETRVMDEAPTQLMLEGSQESRDALRPERLQASTTQAVKNRQRRPMEMHMPPRARARPASSSSPLMWIVAALLTLAAVIVLATLIVYLVRRFSVNDVSPPTTRALALANGT